MSGHTPGPWVIDWNVSRLDIFGADEQTQVATLRRSTIAPDIDAKARANARLIAAAPELLAALQAIAEGCSFPQDDVQRAIRDRARAAIAKATQP